MGHLAFVLHAHLPFVRHPEHPRFMEEEWLFEAITETYIPLLAEFDAMRRDGLPFRVTMSMTPPLCEMLRDELLQKRYLNHINRLRELAEKECSRLKHDEQFGPLAAMYRNRFEVCYRKFIACGRDLVGAFQSFMDSGHLEIITCCATHGFLPNLRQIPGSVDAQLEVAVRNYDRHFNRTPRGIWLAECGYFPGLDASLAKAGLRYFFTDTHALLQGDPPSPKGCYAPVVTPSGVYAFARDPESSKSVWSSEEGYPGDFRYREFYRDIGFDLPMETVKNYIHPMGIRVHTGIKYHRITGKGEGVEKQPYVEAWAEEAAESHASNFLFNRDLQCDYLEKFLGGPATVVCPYDAELFGHWWYEGPMWLGKVMRKALTENHRVTLATPPEILAAHAELPQVSPAFSSWGSGGYAEFWLNGSNDWIYPHLHHAATLMRELAQSPETSDRDRRARSQMARELLLAQASDWAFIMKTGTTVDYAIKRTKTHIHNVLELHRQIRASAIDEDFLRNLELTDNLFPEIDYKSFGR